MPKGKVLGTGPGLHITDLLKRGSQSEKSTLLKLKQVTQIFKIAYVQVLFLEIFPHPVRHRQHSSTFSILRDFEIIPCESTQETAKALFPSFESARIDIFPYFFQPLQVVFTTFFKIFYFFFLQHPQAVSQKIH